MTMMKQSMRLLSYEKAEEAFKKYAAMEDNDPEQLMKAKEQLELMATMAKTEGDVDEVQFSLAMNRFIMHITLISGSAAAIDVFLERLALVIGSAAMILEPMLYVMKGLEKTLEKLDIPPKEVFEAAETYMMDIYNSIPASGEAAQIVQLKDFTTGKVH